MGFPFTLLNRSLIFLVDTDTVDQPHPGAGITNASQRTAGDQLLVCLGNHHSSSWQKDYQAWRLSFSSMQIEFQHYDITRKGKRRERQKEKREKKDRGRRKTEGEEDKTVRLNQVRFPLDKWWVNGGRINQTSF